MHSKIILKLLTVVLSLSFLFGCNNVDEQENDPAPPSPEVQTPGMDEEEPDLDEEPSEEEKNQ